MPLYEFSCRACDKQFTFLSGVVADNGEPMCPRCQSRDLQKLMSRFRRGRSEDERMEAVAERMENKDLDDPQVARRFAREMGREMEGEAGESFSDELEELIDEEMHDEATGGSSSNSDDGTIY